MAYTDVDLCSAALAKLGAQPITSLADESAEALIAARLYPIARDALLSAHPWTFTLAETPLERDPAAEGGEFRHAFLLPADLLRTISAGGAGRSRGLVYRIYGPRLVSDAPSVTLAYQRRVEPTAFPPYFAAALVARLAAEFCLPITESTARAEVLGRLAASELKLARLLDSQQSTPAHVEDYTLVAARHL
jgi:hypothetical protein